MQNGNGQHIFWQPFAQHGDLHGLRARMAQTQHTAHAEQGAAARAEQVAEVAGRERQPVSVTVRHRGGAPTRAPADVFETQDAVVVALDMPGHDATTMDLSLEKGILTIRSTAPERNQSGRTYLLSERSHGTVERAFELPATVDPDKIEASFDAGVLTVTLLKREESKPRKIAVKIGS